MRAAVRTRYGPPQVVRISDVPAPVVCPNELRVAVHATTVNRSDCGTLAAKPFFIRAFTGLVHPRATILGNDVMVYGATCAIGSAAVQLLADIGAAVVAVGGTAGVTSSSTRSERVRSDGSEGCSSRAASS